MAPIPHVSSSTLYLLGVLAANVALSEWLVRHTRLRHLGSALLVIVLTAVAANVGLLPPYSDDVPVYTFVFGDLAPLGIFWLLLRVNLADLRAVGLPMLGLFLLGAVGTILGVMAGLAAVGGGEAFGDLAFALGGMFTGTYIGGSVNFNAIALEYGVVEDARLYAGAAVVDSAMTTLWMAATVALPRLLARFAGARSPGPGGATAPAAPLTGVEEDTEAVHPLDLSLLVALGALAVWASRALTDWIAEASGYAPPSILVLSTIALALAQCKPIATLRGSRLLGMVAVLLFLAVIGALCDVSALRGLGPLGLDLSLFVVVLVGVHGLVVFGGALAFRADPTLAAVCSQANIGGGTSALALARSLGRADLVLPAILVGSLGIALGTYCGFAVAEWLR